MVPESETDDGTDALSFAAPDWPLELMPVVTVCGDVARSGRVRVPWDAEHDAMPVQVPVSVKVFAAPVLLLVLKMVNEGVTPVVPPASVWDVGAVTVTPCHAVVLTVADPFPENDGVLEVAVSPTDPTVPVRLTSYITFTVVLAP